MGGKELALRVQRFDPSIEEGPRFQLYTVPLKDGMTVLDALLYAKDRLDHGIARRGRDDPGIGTRLPYPLDAVQRVDDRLHEG